MSIGRIPFSELEKLPEIPEKYLECTDGLSKSGKKIIVLDDDPTGTQTVCDTPVYTDWEADTIERAFRDAEHPMFYVLTNSRGLTADETEPVHRTIAENIVAASKKTGLDYVLISRSDSTLRGHYPLETRVLRETIEALSDKRFDAEIICPFFPEGGRYTVGDVHYVRDGDELVPAGETEFARDKTFGYKSSEMRAWCEEKSGGAVKAGEVLCISIEEERACDVVGIAEKLMQVRNFGKVVVNCASYADLRVFAEALNTAAAAGRGFMFRSAAAVPKVLGGIPDRPLLCHDELVDHEGGGLIIAGSHTARTTSQLESLKNSGLPVTFVEFDQHLAAVPGGLEGETKRVAQLAGELLRKGESVAVCTRRERYDPPGDKEEQLRVSVAISSALTAVVSTLTEPPAFIIAKGGITSSDVATTALGIRRAMVIGQISAGIPVWRAPEDSRFPGSAYVIFPGNVGTEDTLTECVRKLMAI